GPCPTFFRATLHEEGPRAAGRILASHLTGVLSESEANQAALDELISLLHQSNEATVRGHLLPGDVQVWGWFRKHLPRCTLLIPADDIAQFVAGVQSAYQDDVMPRRF